MRTQLPRREVMLIRFVLFLIAMSCCAISASASQLTAAPRSGSSPLTVQFSYPVTDATTNWMLALDFGDGEAGRMQRTSKGWGVSHTYRSAGSFNAVLSRAGLPLCVGCKAPVVGKARVTVRRKH